MPPLKTQDVLDFEASTQNGKIPNRRLEEIVPRTFDLDLNGPARMYSGAAKAMSAMLAAADEDGLNFTVKYSYRTLAVQWIKWANFQNGGNVAAFPGTSNHGDGLSADLTNLGEDDINWLRRHAAKYGFYNDVAGEIWHWTYYGGFEPSKEDDVKFELYTEGWDKYIERFENKGEDPGDAPPEREAAFKKGWKHARKAMNNPKGK